MEFNLTSEAAQQNPYPEYARLRQSDEPILVNHQIARNAYLFTRYEDVKQILTDPRFINDMRNMPGAEDWTQKWYVPGVLKSLANTMALADEPDHGRLRQLVHKAFTPKRIRDLEANIDRMANELLDTAGQQEVIDFIDAFALPLPLNVICDMMGVTTRDRKKFHIWMSNTITSGFTLNPIDMIQKLRSTLGLNRFLSDLIEERRKNPGDDLTSALVQAEADGDKLSEQELLAMLFLILFAGHETTVNLIGNGTLALLQHPEQFALLKANPALLDAAIEEMLRYTNPVQHIAFRYATEEMQVGKITVPHGATVMLNIAAANRDETVFEKADQFDITRKDNKHLAFGFGIHYCLGAPLARIEAKIAFETLLRRYPNLELAVPVQQLRWKGAPPLRGLETFPMRLNAPADHTTASSQPSMVQA